LQPKHSKWFPGLGNNALKFVIQETKVLSTPFLWCYAQPFSIPLSPKADRAPLLQLESW